VLDEAPAPRIQQRNRFGLRPRVLKWGGLLATAATVVVLALPRGGSLMVLADAGPLPVAVDTTRSGMQAMDRGLIAYAAGDYRTSRDEFAHAATENAVYGEAYLYLGSSQLQLGKVSDAITSLQTAAELADPEELDRTGAAAHWLLGNAYLLAEDGAAAREQFEIVIALKGLFVEEAQTQLQKMNSAN
jgi:tetratricopeptide (TPR) repeat protein